MRTLFLALALAACTQAPPPAPVPGEVDLPGETLVTVDGHAITQGMLDVSMGPLPQSKRDELLGDPARKRELLNRMAFADVLYRKALAAKLHEEQDTKSALALAQREILANMMLDRIGKEAVTDEAIQARYDSMAVQFKRPQAKVQYMLIKKQDEANQLVEQLKSGELDFLEAAKQHSADPTISRHGGDLGWTPRAPVRELADAWANAPLNEIIGPIEGHLGFHIVRITDRRDSVPLDEVRDYLSEQVKIDAMKKARREIMGEAEIVWPDEGGEAPAEPAPEDGANSGGPQ